MRAKGKEELSGFIALPLRVLQPPTNECAGVITRSERPPEERYTTYSVSQCSDIGLMGTTFESAEFRFLFEVQVSGKCPVGGRGVDERGHS